jgi:hypothetical protein
MTGANRSILLPVVHKRLDIAADDRLTGSFSERHDIPPVCRIICVRLYPVAALQSAAAVHQINEAFEQLSLNSHPVV